MAFDPTTLPTTAAQVQLIYTAYFGRSADPLGLEFYVDALDARTAALEQDSGLSPEQARTTALIELGNQFAESQEAQANFPFLTDPVAEDAVAFVNNAFEFLFDRDAEGSVALAEDGSLRGRIEVRDDGSAVQLDDATGEVIGGGGLAVYVDRVLERLERDVPELGEVIFDIIGGAQNDDVTALENKVQAAEAYTAELIAQQPDDAPLDNDNYDLLIAQQLVRDRVTAETDPDIVGQIGTEAARSFAKSDTFAFAEATDGDDDGDFELGNVFDINVLDAADPSRFEADAFALQVDGDPELEVVSVVPVDRGRNGDGPVTDGTGVGEAVDGNNGGTFTIAPDGSIDFDPTGVSSGTLETTVLYTVEATFDTNSPTAPDDTTRFATSEVTVDFGEGGAAGFEVPGDEDPGGDDPAPAPPASPNFAPTARDDDFTLSGDGEGPFNVLDNDSDPDGDNLTVSIVQPSADGDASVTNKNEITFQPADEFTGETSLTYQVSDGNGGTDTASVTFDVVNRSPIAGGDEAVTGRGESVIIDVLQNDSDPDGGVVSVDSASDPSNGQVAINDDGTLTYTPNDEFTGKDAFNYTVSDSQGGTDTANVSVRVDKLILDELNTSLSSIEYGTGDYTPDNPENILVEQGEAGGEFFGSGGDGGAVDWARVVRVDENDTDYRGPELDLVIDINPGDYSGKTGFAGAGAAIDGDNPNINDDNLVYNYRFVEHGTDTPVTLDEFHFSFRVVSDKPATAEEVELRTPEFAIKKGNTGGPIELKEVTDGVRINPTSGGNENLNAIVKNASEFDVAYQTGGGNSKEAWNLATPVSENQDQVIDIVGSSDNIDVM
jgi:hypothetical protein